MHQIIRHSASYNRADGIVDLCEMKWSSAAYALTRSCDLELRNKAAAFAGETRTRKAVRIVLVTPFGLKQNAYANGVQAETTVDGLFDS